MSLLWPETIYAGLFPGHCWLRRRYQEEQSLIPDASEPTTLLFALERLLAGQTRPLRKNSRLVVMVSDSLAFIHALPWQDGLSRVAEIESYAQICFDKAGMPLGNDWVLHTEFRWYGGMGLAYALPRGWMESLCELTTALSLRLTAVLPVSAAAYCGQRINGKSEQTLLLLQEKMRSTAMVIGKQGLSCYDVEPFVRSHRDTHIRLLNRIRSGNSEIAHALHWSSEQMTPEISESPIAMCFPDAKLHSLDRHAWN